MLLFVFMISSSIFGIVSQSTHLWAHIPHPPRIARWLQKMGLLVRPETHHKHHRPPFSSHFSILNGWSNIVLDRIGIAQLFRKVLSGGRPPDQNALIAHAHTLGIEITASQLAYAASLEAGYRKDAQ